MLRPLRKMEDLLIKKLLFIVIACLSSLPAFGSTLTCLTNLSGQCATLAADISVTGNGANLTIANIGPLTSGIDAIYFDTTGAPGITGIVIGSSVGTVSFSSGANPANLPNGGVALPPFVSSFAIQADGGTGPRIGIGESLTVSATGGNLGTLFESGAVRIGLHVQSVGTSAVSESLVATNSPLTAA